MVLEAMVTPDRIGSHPARMLIFGFVYSTVGLFLGFFIFRGYASLSSVFLASMPLIVIVHNALKVEEKLEMYYCNRRFLIKCHFRVLEFFMFLFLGLTLGFFFWYTILPQSMASELSQSQATTINSIKSSFMNEEGVTGNVVADDLFFQRILENNMRVLLFCVLFSFLYGAGAIFILTWNAFVIAVVLSQQFSLNYFFHGIPEILAYFMAALGGGIISVAVANHHYRTKEFKRIIVDSIDLIVLAVIVLIIAAFIETYQIQALNWFSRLLWANVRFKVLSTENPCIIIPFSNDSAAGNLKGLTSLKGPLWN